MSKSCVNCKFMLHTQGNEYGQCRRYPPQINPEGEDSDIASLSPVVAVHHWCGEWKPKEERFEELLRKSLDDKLTDEEAEELSTLALERSRPLLESEAKYIGKLTEISRTNDKLIQLLQDENGEQTE